MKYFAITKIGYTAGVYGNSGEQFLAIWTDKDGLKSYAFEGQYGVEDRVADVFKEKGYKQTYIGDRYGRMTRNEVKRMGFNEEYRAIDELKYTI